MNWDRYRSVMERYAIKTDDMATEDAYFMATHMPFAQLEVLEGGQTTAAPDYLSEEEVFEKLVYNPENLHRLIIVRGNNGTGKSHLIRYLKARLENSPSTSHASGMARPPVTAERSSSRAAVRSCARKKTQARSTRKNVTRICPSR